MRARSLILLPFVALACQRTPDTEAPGARPAPQAAAFYVSDSGSAEGTGSRDQPWTLEMALGHPAAVQPGDTIWLRGGTYRGNFTSTLTGGDEVPIIVRQYPGERATIDGSLVIKGASTTYWGFEVTRTGTEREDVQGIDVQGPRTRLVNLVVHDHGGSGIGLWSAAPDAEVYGTIVYNNGHQGTDRGHGHGIYAQNRDGRKRIADNIVFNQFSHGIHVYGSNTAFIRNFEIEGNTSFNNGSLSEKGNAPDLLVGGGSAAEGILVAKNATYRADGLTSVVFGDADGPMNGDLTLRDNYVVGATKLSRWNAVTVDGNTFTGTETLLFLNAVGDSATRYAWDRNTYVSKPGTWQPFVLTRGGTNSLDFVGWRGATGADAASAYQRVHPTGTQVLVRPNRYEPGRATIVVYNWDARPEVSVDLGQALPAGTRFEVRNVQDLAGAPVLSGTYTNAPLTLPMRGVAPPAPVGSTATAPVTGPIFNVFLVTAPADAAAGSVAAAPRR